VIYGAAALAGCGAAVARADWQVVSTVPAAERRGNGKASVSSPLVRHVVQTLREAGGAEGDRQATLHFVLFDAQRATFKVVDQGAGGRLELGAAMRGAGCLAGVNGGYFHEDFRPLGLVVSDGKEVHPGERAALLSGLVIVGADGRPALVRAEEYRAQVQSAAAPPRQALQAGPFLVDGGHAVPGLNAVRAARRTVVLTDGAGRWALASTSGLTLAETGAVLAQPGIVPSGLRVRRALNLDGGSSTGLWVAAEAGAGEPAVYLREWSTVRNFLGVVPR